MPKQTYVTKRNGIYYFRRVLTDELAALLGKREIKKSLKTSDYRKACTLANIEAVKADEAIEHGRLQAIRNKESAEVYIDLENLGKTEIERIALIWFAKNDQLAREENSKIFLAGLPEEQREVIQQNILDELGIWQNEDIHTANIVWKTARELLDERKIRYDKNSNNFQYFCQLIHDGYLESAMRAKARCLNRESVERSYNRFFATAEKYIQGEDAIVGYTLDQLIMRFMEDPKRKALTDHTLRSYTEKMAFLKECIGENTRIKSLTREHIRDVRKKLLNMPVNANKKFKGKSVEEKIELGKAQKINTLKPETINHYLIAYSALFDFAVKEDWLEKNIAVDMLVIDKVRDKDKRHPFSIEQLNAIFAAPLYTGCEDDEMKFAVPGPHVIRRGRFWVPLLALWTGMRLSECCQLFVEDIDSIDGIDVIRVRVGEDTEEYRRLKTKSATRIIPIHPELKKMGFLEYVDDRKDKPHKELFPDLTKGRRDGGLTDPFQKWFNRFLKKVGAYSDKTTFHSFRHNFRDAQRNAMMPPEVAKFLGGWANGAGVEDNYGSHHKPELLYREIAKIQYDGLDLSHLYL